VGQYKAEAPKVRRSRACRQCVISYIFAMPILRRKGWACLCASRTRSKYGNDPSLKEQNAHWSRLDGDELN
jgi:hypothetical protein